MSELDKTKTVEPKVEAPKAKTKEVKATPKAAAVKATPKAEVKTEAKASTTKLPTTVFGVKVNTQAIFDTIMSERASRRQGTHKVKHRGEVRGGGKKPWAQKHTGRARAGSTRSPIWVGGGTVFGPNPERNYKLKVNKKYRKVALASALTLKATDDAVVTHEFKIDKISTKNLLNAVAALKLKDTFKKVLIVTDNETVFTSGKNAESLRVQKLSGLGVETIVEADVMIISTADIKKLEGMVK